MPTTDSNWLSTGQAAQALGVRSINTVKRLIREGRLRAIRPGGHYRVSAEDVRRLSTRGATTLPRLDPRDAINAPWLVAWAGRHRVSRVHLFGSAARGELQSQSDVDIAIEFLPGSGVGLFEMVEMKDELSERFGRPVDLGTLRSMKPGIRRRAELDLVTLV
jgi:excisionase family DNA binding protein